MQITVPASIRQGSIRAAVGADAYSRGASYARRRAVSGVTWDPQRFTLQGAVRGTAPEPYRTAVILEPGAGGAWEFASGRCTCPVQFNCKHTAALVLTAAPAASTPKTSTPKASTPKTSTPKASTPKTSAASTPKAVAPKTIAPKTAAPPASASRAWAQPLERLLAPAPAAGAGGGQAAAQPADTPLAVEIRLATGPDYRLAALGARVAGRTRVKAEARLMQPGKNGWIGGNLMWKNLGSLQFYGGYRAEHLRLLRELYAMYQLGHDYGYAWSANDRCIDLTAIESRQLWPLLDEAEAAGVQLVQPRGLPPVRRCDAELCLDITRAPDGGLDITPQLRIAGERAAIVPLAFVGSQGHGLVFASLDDAENGEPASWPLRLARLTRPAGQELQQLTLQSASLRVPAAGEAALREEFYPRLRHAATVISSDGSFTPPQISGPTLLLRAAYGAHHDLDLTWEWAYEIGDAPKTAPLDSIPSAEGFRDLIAERKALTTLDLPLAKFGLATASGRAGTPAAPAPQARLRGADTMRFSTEFLPLLAAYPGVAVEVTGEPADYREAGDSLQIGVSAGAIEGDTDWFDLGITISVEGREIPFLDVFTALARGESYLLLDDGAYFSLDKPELQALARLIEEARALTDAPPGELRISRFQAGLWSELSELGVVVSQASAWQQQVQGLLSLGSDTPLAEPPAGLTASLRPYQLQGLHWLTFLWRHQIGGILADDMGLGKTLQVLALIAHARGPVATAPASSPATAPDSGPGSPPFLIVAPASVVSNWAAEAARFTPGLRVLAITETVARSGRDLGDLIAGADAVVTSYTLLRLDADEYCARDWSGVILDEAQFVKNHQSKLYQCVRRVRSPFKLAVTGTPMENNLMELWSLLSITAPGLFPSPVRFREYYAAPIERQGQGDLLAQLRRRIRPLVLRRTKELVAAELPAKQEQVLRVELHPRHAKAYQTRLQRERQKVLGLVGDMNANRFTILRSLTLLRQLSLHAVLVDDADADVPCAKIDTLLDQLSEVVAGGHRALVFSQFTAFLGLVRSALDEAGIACCYLDGKTRDRASEIRRFKEGAAPVFLISLKAGGFGLNLTEADYCFVLDPWWNPATEAQAVDRTHRIGQTRNVMVYRLIASGTIEEKVMALQARKARLFTDVIDGEAEDHFSAALTLDDIRALIE